MLPRAVAASSFSLHGGTPVHENIIIYRSIAPLTESRRVSLSWLCNASEHNFSYLP